MLDPRLDTRSQLENFCSEADSTKLYEHLLYACKHARYFYVLSFLILTTTSKTDLIIPLLLLRAMMLRQESDMSRVTWLACWKSRIGGHACLSQSPVLTPAHLLPSSAGLSHKVMYSHSTIDCPRDPALLPIGDSPPAWCVNE